MERRVRLAEVGEEDALIFWILRDDPGPSSAALARGLARTATVARMSATRGIVLAGGRSSRMGTPKAALEWHGSTLLRRVTGIVARAAGGPVVVVRAPGQELPALPRGVEIAEDAREGRGPLQGLAAGLAAVEGPRRAWRSSPRPTRRCCTLPSCAWWCGSLDGEHDVALPQAPASRTRWPPPTGRAAARRSRS